MRPTQEQILKKAKSYDKSGIRTHAPFETRNAPKNMEDQIHLTLAP